MANEGLHKLDLCSTGPMGIEGSLSCHTCCETGPRLESQQGLLSNYSNPDPHGLNPCCYTL